MNPLRTECRRGRLAIFITLFSILFGSRLIAQTTVTSRVSAELDDMEEIIATGTIDETSSDLELVNEGAGDQIIGLRFPSLTIPQGAVITSARLQFTADETNDGLTTLTLKAQASDSAAQFAVVNNSVSSRPTGTASVTWTVSPWNVIQEQSTDQRSPEIKTLVQEVTGRAGWKSGNALALIITGSGKRVAESYEGAAGGSAGHSVTQTATITVTYIIPTTLSVRVNAGADDAEENVTTGAIDLTSSDLELTEDGTPVFQQYIGMRFNNVNIPRNAIITSAYVQFATDELFSSPTSLTIRGQAADNAATFTTSANNISSRPVTAASVAWSPAAWNVLQEAGVNQRTPDLSPIVQEIVSRSGWNSFNSMVIRINGTGRRTAEAYDGSAGEAPQLVVRYYTVVPVTAPVGTFPVPRNAVWTYLDNGSDQGTAWRDTSFNDSNWAFGPAQLGYGDNDEGTVVGFGPSSSNRHITTYFRHTFNVASTALIDSLRISLLRDDGAIVYLNGREVYRSNMPEGTVDYRTLASSNVSGTAESQYFIATIGTEGLRAGRNVLAVEVHQDAVTSTDLSFALGLEGKRNDVKILSSVSSWEYRDDGTFPGANWYTESFSDTSWKYGASPLGYGNGNEATRVSYGGDRMNKHITTYFRKTFTVGDTTGLGSLLLRLRRDDGAIVYLNGVELLRDNMPAGPVDNMTLATTYVEGAEEEGYLSYYINRNLIRPGSNLIAVEVHQNTPTSTDMAFDLELILQEGTRPLTVLGVGSGTPCDPANATIGCFTSVIPTPQQESFVYPMRTHTFQRLIKSTQDVYTGTTTTLPNGNDFTGFAPLGGSSTEGVLSINHENTPGGVSMLDLRYNGATALWKIDAITAVDFRPVVQTVRNCSGTVTPWGTIITSEETYSTGDANADGYQDIGWNVEIDPVTKRIRDYDGDGKPDKLWMVGRMNHENVVVAQDSVTLYQGEDGGTGCVYKFVAARKARLDSGALYVLKRDGANATTGTWVRVPNATRTDRNTVATVAGALGGMRFGGVEDVEIAPDGMIYFTEKGLGDIWRFRDNGGTVSQLEKYVTNRTYPITTEAGVVNEVWNTGNDNLAFDGEGNLWVLQDGGRDHIWMVRNDHTPASPKIELFATSPAGSEPTGITFSPDYRFMFISFQNPSGANTATQKDAADSTIVFNASTTIVVARKEHLGPGALPPVVDLGEEITVCEGNVVELKYNNPNALGVWGNNSTDTVLRVTESGRYHLMAIGNNGQIARDTVTVSFVPLPHVELGADRTFCEGAPMTITLDPTFTYFWEDGSAGFTRTISAPGRYHVTAMSASGCSAYDTVEIAMTTAPRPSLGDNRAICRGESVRLTPGRDFTTYRWSTGATDASIDVTQPGRYWVVVTGATGCSAVDTVEVTMSPVASLGADVELCEGSSAVLNVGATYASYQWSTGATTPTLQVTQPGEYWVRVADPAGCESIDTLRVIAAPMPTVNLGRDTAICATCNITLDAGEGFSGYQWSTGATTRTITVSEPGNYTVAVKSDRGCTGYDEIDVMRIAVSGVDNVVRNEKFALSTYPNPFTTEVTVRVDLVKRGQLLVEVYDLAGVKVTTLVDGVKNAGRHELKLDAAALGGANGLFMVKVTADGSEAFQKIVRQ